MTGGYHYTLKCSDCGYPIPLPLEILEHTFALPEAQSKEFLAATCNHGMHVRPYNLERTTETPPPGRMESLPDSGWRLVEWLKCAETTCRFRLPLFAHVNSATSPEQLAVVAKTWEWSELICPAGHTIPMPQ
jgi:hypothetical protein